MCIGYFHGYKGYRFCGESRIQIQYESFNQLSSVVDFDEELKSIMYSPLMKLETAIKSYVCDSIVTYVKSSSFSDVFKKGLQAGENKKEANYKMRDAINSAMTRKYQGSAIVRHFYNADTPIPLWAIIEELMLGELSTLIDTLNADIKYQISEKFGITKGLNTNGELLSKIVLAVKDLRNAVAHNKVLFDCRYMEFKKRDSLVQMLSKETGIEGINGKSLIDDIIIVCFLLKNLEFRKDEIRKVPLGIKKSLDSLKKRIPNRIYQSITFGLDTKKLSALENYIKCRKSKIPKVEKVLPTSC